jgi:hypothetical protein
MASQVVHAAGESSPGDLPDGTFAVVLGAEDERALLTVADRLSAAGVGHVLIRESDSPFCGQAMAIGVRPGRRSQLKKYLSSLPLLR